MKRVDYMLILHRYVFKEFSRNFFLLLFSFLSLYIIIDFFEKIRMFISNQATLSQIFFFFLFSIPMIFWQVLPASVLIASLVSVSSLLRRNEITAFKACGISIHAIGKPIIIIGMILSFFSLFFAEFITPFTNAKADHIKEVEIKKKERFGVFKQNQIWYRGRKGIYNFQVFDPRAESIQGITLYYVDDELNLKKRIDGSRGFWRNGRWIFYDVMVTTFSPKGDPEVIIQKELISDLPEGPSDFKEIQKPPEAMGIRELRRYVREIESKGYNATTFRVDLHGKIAFPFVNVIMALLGVYLAAYGRRGGKTFGFAVGLAIGFSYWFVFSFAIALGQSGSLFSLLAAWFANILFGLVAAIVALTVTT